ncbi:MAG: hypothetical protein IKJ01_04495 [Lachnospiraceae bacterium]|nr:hypothetical protein [Lachnospiraceae bacterium]
MSEDKKLNEIIRVQKRPKRFVVMDKTFLEDSRLSFKAKGILAYLLSKPDDWKVVVGNLVNYSADGKSAVYAGLRELKEYGYYEKVPVRNEQGTRIIRWESVVYEVPRSLLNDDIEAEETEHIEDVHQEQDEQPRQQELQKQLEVEECLSEQSEQVQAKVVQNSEVSLYADFQKVENEHQQNCLRNNNYYTNNLHKLNENIMSSQTEYRQPKVDVDSTISLVHENIGYKSFKIAHADDIGLIDEFVNIMVDALLSQNETVRIRGENKPKQLVKSNLMKLTYGHVEHVLWQFKEYAKRIKKKQQYILSMLYTAPMEFNAHYTNCVQADGVLVG